METSSQEVKTWRLLLYVAGESARYRTALSDLKQVCEQYLDGNYSIEVVDVLVNPERAQRDHILAVPTVVKKSPLPERRLIGDLSHTELVLEGLDIPNTRRAAPENKAK